MNTKLYLTAAAGFRTPAKANFFATGGTAPPLVRFRLAGRASPPSPDTPP